MKKILLGIGSLAMIGLPLASVVSCGSSDKKNISPDQTKINNIKTKLSVLNLSFNELPSGAKTFISYENLVLDQIKSKLNKEEQKAISIDKSSGNVNLTTNEQNIKVNIISGSDHDAVNVPIKLNFDAQSIANKISALTIEIERKIGQDESGNYKDKIIGQLKTHLTQEELAVNPINDNVFNSVKLSHIVNKDNMKFNKWINVHQNINIKIGKDSVVANFNLSFTGQINKNTLDDPGEFDQTSPMPIDWDSRWSGNTIKASDWNNQPYVLYDRFREWWSADDGIPTNLDNNSDVKFSAPFDVTRGQKYKIQMQIPALGYDGNEPGGNGLYREFYVEFGQ